MILGTLQISGSRQYSENEVNFHHLWIFTTAWEANKLLAARSFATDPHGYQKGYKCIEESGQKLKLKEP